MLTVIEIMNRFFPREKQAEQRRSLAILTHTTYSNVHEWISKNYIPEKYWSALIQVGIFSVEDLHQMNEKSRRAKKG